MTFGPFQERHSLDGVVVKIGAADGAVPVWLQDGDGPLHVCETTVQTSMRLAAHGCQSPIRAHGTGTWTRADDGTWRMQAFRIDDFEPLDDRPLAEVVRQLQAVGGSRWHEMADPLEEARRLRVGDD